MNIFGKRSLKQLILFVMLPLFVMPLSLIGSEVASAVTRTSSSSSAEDQATSYWYYMAMLDCFTGGVERASLNAANVETGKLFVNLNGADEIFGYFALPLLDGIGDDGRAQCREAESQLSGKALAFWGITGPELYCGMGYTRENTQSCLTGDNNFVAPSDPAARFTSYIRTNVFGGKDPAVLSDAAKYAFLSSTFINACTSGGGLSIRPSDAGPNALFTLATGTNASGATTNTYFNVPGNRSFSWPAYTYVDGGNTQRTCKQLVDEANSSFSSYVGARACASNATIARSPSLLEACTSGASNKSNDAFCADNYKDGGFGGGSADRPQIVNNKEARKACYAGQGRGAAEDCINRERPYATKAEVEACISGSLNRTDVNFCNANYPVPATNIVLRQACLDGQLLTGGYNLNLAGIVSNVDCLINPSAVGCPGADSSSCVVEGVGWIVCPLFNFLGGVADASFALVETFLKTDVNLLDQDTGTARAWGIMRNLANVGFVIVFLIIIFSQLSSVGITNYGVKKMLPRLIIAAILVNLSYFISQIAVDLSNILGGSLKTVLDNLAVFPGGTGNPIGSGKDFFGNLVGGVLGGQLLLAGAAAAGAAAYIGGAALLIPIVLAAVLALVVTILILIARQALIVLLVVVSPLAFLAMLLPNTENLFKQWRKIFVALLILYPAVALLFGASTLAAGILLQSGANQGLIGQLMAAAVMVLPLFALPAILKGSLNAVPGIGQMATSLQNRANGNLTKNAKKGFENSRLGQFQKYRQGVRDKNRALAQGGSYTGNNPFYKIGSSVSKRINNSALSGDFGNSQASAGIVLAEAQEAEQVKAAAARIRSTKPNPAQLRALALGGQHGGIDTTQDHAARAAAVQAMVASNDIAGMRQLWDNIKTETGPTADKLRDTFGDSLQASNGRPVAYGQGAIAELRRNAHATYDTTLIGAIEANAYSAEKIAGADKDDLADVLRVVGAGMVSTAGEIQLRANANTTGTTPQLDAQISKNRAQVDALK